MVYMDPELKVTEENRLFGIRNGKDEIEEAMYAVLKDTAVLPKQKAYTVKINETTLHFSSKEEVIRLLEETKNRFDVNDEFTVELVEYPRISLPR